MKKSLLYAFIGIVLYLGQNIIYALLTGSTSIESQWAVLISCLIVLGILFAIIHNKDKLSYYGISMGSRERFRSIYVAVLLIPLINVPYLFQSINFNVLEMFIGCVFVGLMEELIFRGFLYRAIEERSGTEKAIVVSSILFGVFHFVNIGNAPIQYVILQVIYATAIGIVYAITFSKTGSLLLCMGSHALVDFIGSWGEPINPKVEIIGTIVCVICALYCWIIRKKEYPIKN